MIGSDMKVIEGQPGKAEAAKPVGAVIVTHGHLGSEFIAAAEMVAGRPLPHVTPASIDWHDDIDVARTELEKAITRVSKGRGVLLLTDMFGGAPTDVASMFLGDPAIEIISGVNLPMILKLADQAPDEALAEVARRVRDAGTEGIHLAGELLAPPVKS
jgi:PTS system mannose-specific IIA component